MKKFFALLTATAAPSAFATAPLPGPQAVPAMDGWGLAAIGMVVALAGAIAVFRTRK